MTLYLRNRHAVRHALGYLQSSRGTSAAGGNLTVNVTRQAREAVRLLIPSVIMPTHALFGPAVQTTITLMITARENELLWRSA